MQAAQQPQGEPETQTLKVPGRHRLLPVRHGREFYSFGLKCRWQVPVLSFQSNTMGEISRVPCGTDDNTAPCGVLRSQDRRTPHSHTCSAVPPSLTQEEEDTTWRNQTQSYCTSVLFPHL